MSKEEETKVAIIIMLPVNSSTVSIFVTIVVIGHVHAYPVPCTQGVPGPGHYPLKSQFEKSTTVESGETEVPFGSHLQVHGVIAADSLNLYFFLNSQVKILLAC